MNIFKRGLDRRTQPVEKDNRMSNDWQFRVKFNVGVPEKFVLEPDYLERLFEKACDIIDTHSYSLRLTIEVVPKKRKAGYDHPARTITISAKNYKAGTLAHEFGHAIICHVFVVPPSETLQEIICGYIDHQITKKGF